MGNQLHPLPKTLKKAHPRLSGPKSQAFEGLGGKTTSKLRPPSVPAGLASLVPAGIRLAAENLMFSRTVSLGFCSGMRLCQSPVLSSCLKWMEPCPSLSTTILEHLQS